MKQLRRTLRTRSLSRLVVGALAVSIVAGVTLTYAVVPTMEGVQLWASGHLTGMDAMSMLLGVLWLSLLAAFPLSIAYWLVVRYR